MVLDDGGFERIDQDRVKFVGEIEQHFLVHEKPVLPVRHFEQTARQALEVHADAGAEAAEEHAAGTEHAPQLRQHRAEMVFIAGEVQHRGAEDHIRDGIGERHVFDLADDQILRGQGSAERSGELAHVLDAFGIGVDGEDFRALAQQVDEIAPVAASGVDDAHAGRDVAAQDLVKDVDIDLSELFLKGEREGVGQGKSYSWALFMTHVDCNQPGQCFGRIGCAVMALRGWPASASMQRMNPTAQLYDFATQVLMSKEFFDRSTRVLEEGDSQFRPREGMMTVAQQVAHTAQTIEWFIDGASRPEGFDLNFAEHARALAEVRSLAEARHRLDNAFARAADFLRSKSPEELAQPLPPGPVMGGQPIRAIIGSMVEHTAHHRGALTVYSRLLGKVPPMPYGM